MTVNNGTTLNKFAFFFQKKVEMCSVCGQMTGFETFIIR